MKMKIVDISSSDDFYIRRNELIGQIGEFTLEDDWDDEWKSGNFAFDKVELKSLYFFEVKVAELK